MNLKLPSSVAKEYEKQLAREKLRQEGYFGEVARKVVMGTTHGLMICGKTIDFGFQDGKSQRFVAWLKSRLMCDIPVKKGQEFTTGTIPIGVPAAGSSATLKVLHTEPSGEVQVVKTTKVEARFIHYKVEGHIKSKQPITRDQLFEEDIRYFPYISLDPSLSPMPYYRDQGIVDKKLVDETIRTFLEFGFVVETQAGLKWEPSGG